ncbi:S41 family peptidase [Haloimpatiens sp. FM7330]|uniref:S41 family peptidase n=1 Tax=Haloimpatiens sp. FM7330 TaxID=3298610 RepID=UPI00362BC355
MFKNQSLVKFKSKFKVLALALIMMVTLIPASVNAEPVNEVRNLIEDHFLYKYDDSVLKTKNINEMVSNLNDIYSIYFTKEEYGRFLNMLNMKFYGLGVFLQDDNNEIKISGIVRNSTVQKAGLKVGDVIVKINDNDLKQLKAQQAALYLNGKPGTNVELVVKRDNKILTFNVKREEVKLPTVMSTVLDKNIGYIRINTFGENASEEFKKNLFALKDKVDYYVIDLINNPGGYINEAVDIAGYFIGEKPVVKVMNKKGESNIYKAPKKEYVIDKPVVFLVNKDTASASEILSAAIKDNKKATIIGQNTYGKGVAQNLFELSDGSVLKLTTQKFVSPLGKEINKIGVKPDIVCSDSALLDTAQSILTKPDFTLNVDEPKESFKVNFNLKINEKFIKNNVRLLDCSTGKYITVDTKLENEKRVVVTPKEKLKCGHNYYLVVDKGIVSKYGTKLKNKVMTRIRIK